ncbi:hypothetical protein AVDCRST_MAG81-5271 [uncultured Synechococcales cyanobacterium]|uniref:Peptidase A2 domain-containing protein n=1 Tax=uncultured Synechococcales cyanobacterium TaxID=1936017 RepID=A0A6J4VYT3_9CYAN|nr:hypothetical protein AVDCRST_MAG81-5271 [uncultured Synechococcales cyanobacterium]
MIAPAPGVVPIEREAGGLIIVKAIFTGPAGSTTCKALLDTGATFSLVPPRVARKIGVKAQGKAIIVGIKSRQLSPITYTDVKLGAAKVKRVQTVTDTLDGFALADVECLLGQSFMRNLSITIESSKLMIQKPMKPQRGLRSSLTEGLEMAGEHLGTVEKLSWPAKLKP